MQSSEYDHSDSSDDEVVFFEDVTEEELRLAESMGVALPSTQDEVVEVVEVDTPIAPPMSMEDYLDALQEEQEGTEKEDKDKEAEEERVCDENREVEVHDENDLPDDLPVLLSQTSYVSDGEERYPLGDISLVKVYRELSNDENALNECEEEHNLFRQTSREMEEEGFAPVSLHDVCDELRRKMPPLERSESVKRKYRSMFTFSSIDNEQDTITDSICDNSAVQVGDGVLMVAGSEEMSETKMKVSDKEKERKKENEKDEAKNREECDDVSDEDDEEEIFFGDVTEKEEEKWFQLEAERNAVVCPFSEALLSQMWNNIEKREKSALVIQTAAKKFMEKVVERRGKEAETAIKREAEKERRRENEAATQISRVVRGFIARVAFSKQQRSISLSLSSALSHRSLLVEQNEYRSATLIQSVVRGFLVRCAVKKEREKEQLITAILNRALERREDVIQTNQHKAALTLQCATRVRLAKKRAREKREEEKVCGQILSAALCRRKELVSFNTRQAASLIAQRYRKWKGDKKAVSAAQTQLRVLRVEKKVREIRHESAVKIQRNFRGFKERKVLRSYQAAASVVQRGYRCHRARSTLSSLKQEKKREQAAIRMQAFIRGCSSRRRTRVWKGVVVKAVTLIQCFARRWKAKRQLSKLKEEKIEEEKKKKEEEKKNARLKFSSFFASVGPSRSKQVVVEATAVDAKKESKESEEREKENVGTIASSRPLSASRSVSPVDKVMKPAEAPLAPSFTSTSTSTSTSSSSSSSSIDTAPVQAPVKTSSSAPATRPALSSHQRFTSVFSRFKTSSARNSQMDPPSLSCTSLPSSTSSISPPVCATPTSAPLSRHHSVPEKRETKKARPSSEKVSSSSSSSSSSAVSASRAPVSLATVQSGSLLGSILAKKKHGVVETKPLSSSASCLSSSTSGLSTSQREREGELEGKEPKELSEMQKLILRRRQEKENARRILAEQGIRQTPSYSLPRAASAPSSCTPSLPPSSLPPSSLPCSSPVSLSPREDEDSDLSDPETEEDFTFEFEPASTRFDLKSLAMGDFTGEYKASEGNDEGKKGVEEKKKRTRRRLKWKDLATEEDIEDATNYQCKPNPPSMPARKGILKVKRSNVRLLTTTANSKSTFSERARLIKSPFRRKKREATTGLSTPSRKGEREGERERENADSATLNRTLSFTSGEKVSFTPSKNITPGRKLGGRRFSLAGKPQRKTLFSTNGLGAAKRVTKN